MKLEIINERWIRVIDGEGSAQAQFLGTREDIEHAQAFNQMNAAPARGDANPHAGYVCPSRRDVDVLTALRTYALAHGMAPSMRELAALTGLRSTSAVAHHIHRLTIAGLVERTPGCARSIRVTPKGESHE